MRHDNVLAYRMAAADGASHLGLLVLVYDAIAADLAQAATAVREGNIEGRCFRSTHALQLLAHLESWVSLMNEADLRTSMNQFYAMLKGSIVRLQAAPHPELFIALANLVSHTRAAWQTKEKVLSDSMLAAALQRPISIDRVESANEERLHLNA